MTHPPPYPLVNANSLSVPLSTQSIYFPQHAFSLTNAKIQMKERKWLDMRYNENEIINIIYPGKSRSLTFGGVYSPIIYYLYDGACVIIFV